GVGLDRPEVGGEQDRDERREARARDAPRALGAAGSRGPSGAEGRVREGVHGRGIGRAPRPLERVVPPRSAPPGLRRDAHLESHGPVFNRPLADDALLACPDCDLLQRLPELEPGASARCPRCDLELWRRRDDALQRALPLTLAAVVLYVVANTFPMLGLSVVGRSAATTVIGGAQQLWHDGRQLTAGLVLFTAVVAPALQIGFMLLILLVGRRTRAPRWAGTLLRHHPTTRTWSMIEVMMLGVLVALIKI